MKRMLMFLIFIIPLFFVNNVFGDEIFYQTEIGESVASEEKESDIIPERITQLNPPTGIYVAFGVGIGFDIQGSSDFDDLLDPYTFGLFGFDRSLQIKVGFKEFLQAEYRWSWRSGSFMDNEDYLISEETSTIDMHHSSKQILLKVNPFAFPGGNDWINKTYLVYGFGESKGFLDDAGDGFKDGKVTTYGVEVIPIESTNFLVLGSFGIEFETVDYKYFLLENFGGNYEYPTSAWCLKFLFSVGVGKNFF